MATRTLKLWHSRLGHVHHAAIKRVSALAGVRGSVDTGEVCETCVKGKMHKRPLPSHSKSRATRPLELVHSDVMGPFTPTSLGGSRYIVTFIDDYSKYVLVRPMKSKDEVLQKIQGVQSLKLILVKRSLDQILGVNTAVRTLRAPSQKMGSEAIFLRFTTLTSTTSGSAPFCVICYLPLGKTSHQILGPGNFFHASYGTFSFL